jgi:hypothetical protein
MNLIKKYNRRIGMEIAVIKWLRLAPVVPGPGRFTTKFLLDKKGFTS